MHKPQGPQTIDIGHVKGSMCCMCGTGGCILEKCKIDGCANAICVTNDQVPCAPTIAEGTWICPLHDDKVGTALLYDANRHVDIQTIELVSFSEWEMLLSATKTTFASYSVSNNVILCFIIIILPR
jgi:hypothetical protein